MKTKKTIIDSIGSLFLFGLILSTLGVSCSKDNNSIKPTDFSTLYAEITAAQNVLSTTTEGILPGQYSADAVATLEGAIATANAVINQGGTAITPSQEAAATVTLTAAVTTYQSSVVAIDPPGTVYVAGWGVGTALWRNGVAISLPGTGFSYGSSVYVTGSGVYVAGDADGENLATVWKNGVATFLRDSINYTNANSVFVLGSDVYVAGEETFIGPNPIWNVTSIAKVWKNGVETSLTDGTYNARASSVFVSGSDVYVAGTDGRVAILWKNGVATALSSVYGTTATSVFVTK